MAINILKQNDNSLLLLNVCYTSEIPERETKGFAEFREKFPDSPINSLILPKDFEGIMNGVSSIPLWKWRTEKQVQSTE